MSGLLIVLIIVVILLVSFVSIYNGLVKLKVLVKNAFADIDVQLKKRHDLVPNLVETVKGYAAHEKTTLENVVKARQMAVQATGPDDKIKSEGALTQALRQLFAVVENYPELKANENFIMLQQQLSNIEEAIQNARRYYNAVVRDYNTRITVFPSNAVASMFGFKPEPFFEIGEPTEREAPRVHF
ncbi:MAG TPA: LemA family protein [Candidatus Hydrothermia bacterium]|nr:LemA family protein [Candidatus Hydrothermae bacterium]MDD3648894.1 LemA family protein [Candidatus Hydrothermia bacterium]MDD5573508.1 LemA family protein [Candidatus Hydrothermia bacterium]HOK23135.1 LemA family protein [Candidatus Hydrothermia bacterium]HOL23839.1 LemA family protein [Candidatus Hydrothermia bacterium]